MASFPLTTLLLAVAALPTAARTVLPLATGWRFLLGDGTYGKPCDLSAFSIPLNGTFCEQASMIFVSSRELCEAACCGDPTCLFFQWCEQPCLPRSPGWGCYNGNQCTSNLTTAVNWTVVARQPPTPTPPPPGDCTDPTLPCAEAFADAGWRTVTVPHDSAVEGAYSPDNDEEHGYLPFNISWYRRTFALPDPATPGSLVWADFDGVYKNSDVWLNGVYLGHHTSGYTPFRYYLHNATLTGSAQPVLRWHGADNVLAVRVDALSVQEGWFYEGAGLYRPVTLTIADPLSIVPWGVYAPTALTGPIASGPYGARGPQTAATASVMPQTDVFNGHATAVTATLVTRLVDDLGVQGGGSGSGACVGLASTQLTLPPGATTRTQQVLQVLNASLWNTEVPYLYRLESSLYLAPGGPGSAPPTDTVSTRIGLRAAVWSPTAGFQLNGFKVPVQGFSNHQSFGGCGNALPPRVDAFRIAALKALGANLWRGSYPYSSALMDAADEQGMMLWVENRLLHYQVQPMGEGGGAGAGGSLPPGSIADPQLLQDAQDMALAARNHPATVLYSLCNEGGCMIGDPAGGLIAAQFKAAITAVDTQHPLTANTEWSVGSPDTLTAMLDVMTCSYNYGTYQLYHDHHPFRPFMGGESASCWSDRGYYAPSNATAGHFNMDFTAVSTPQCASAAWAAAASTEWASGNVAWTGFDYNGEPGPGSYPDVSSHFGVLDVSGYAKDRAGYYLSQWRSQPSAASPTPAPFLQLSPRDWTSPVALGQPVHVYAWAGGGGGGVTAAQAFLNGVSLGLRNVSAFSYADWGLVAFQPGNLTAVGYGGAQGELEVAWDAVHTLGPPVAVALRVEDLLGVGGPLRADGVDVALVQCAVLDAAGAVHPAASHTLTFTVSGPGAVYGVRNGDPADLTPNKVGQADLGFGGVWALPAYHGLARVIVQTREGQPGAITLSVTASGIPGSANVTFVSV